MPVRRLMSRAVAPVKPLARNENLAIVTIAPLPGNPKIFPAVRGVIRDFLNEEVGIPFTDIQPTSLGQAMVRLRDAHARDALLQDSPHEYDNVLVSSTKYDRGRNWRSAVFNQECWLLLLDFPRTICLRDTFSSQLQISLGFSSLSWCMNRRSFISQGQG